jgi:hypothetical protein
VFCQRRPGRPRTVIPRTLRFSQHSDGSVPSWLPAGFAVALASFSIADLQGHFIALTRVRVAFLVACLALSWAAWIRRSALRRPELLLLVFAGMALTSGLALWSSLKDGAPDGYRLIKRFSLLSIGWTVGLLLIGNEAETTRRRLWLSRSRVALPCIVLIAFSGALASHRILEGRHTIINDESLYLLQSRMFGEPGFGRPIAASERPFFLVQQTGIRDGRLRTQYPPGWPCLLALFRGIGLQEWCGGILLAIAVACAYLLGREVHSAHAGLIAAALLATSPIVLRYSGTYMAHAALLACVVPAAWLLLRGEDRAGRARLVSWLCSGLLLGVTFAIRPLTGALIGLSLGLWLLCRQRLRARDLALAAGMVLLGVLPALLATLHYNQITNGYPLTFGYEAVNGPLHALGFGPRGFVKYDSLGRPYAEARDFTIRTGFDNTVERLWDLANLATPAFLLPTLLVLTIYHRRRVRWSRSGVFLALPAGQLAYFYSEPRFYIELLPFFFVGIGVLFAEVAIRQRRVALGVLVLALLGNIALSANYVWRSRPIATLRLFHEIDAAQKTHSRLLVFVPAETAPIGILQWYNVDAFAGPVLVARDLGGRNLGLIRQYPDRVPMRVVQKLPTDVARLLPYRVQNGAAADESR